MKLFRFGLVVAVTLVLFGTGLAPIVRPALAQSGTIVSSATLSVFVTNASGETIHVHRITAPWNETTVTWNNFAGNFDPTIMGTFVADTTGWRSVDVTALVQSWHDGTAPNYGLVLEQGDTPYTSYVSSEYATLDLRPRLDVTYTVVGGSTTTSYTIQRPNGIVSDAYVWALNPDINYNYESFYTGDVSGALKYALLQFERLPTAVHLQSLTAHSSVSSELVLVAIGTAGALGMVVLRRRRER